MIRVQGLGFRGFIRVKGLGCRVEGLEFWVLGLGCDGVCAEKLDLLGFTRLYTTYYQDQTR